LPVHHTLILIIEYIKALILANILTKINIFRCI